MLHRLPENLIKLAFACEKPLYVVGGSVRDFLAELTPSFYDFDICSAIKVEELVPIATACGLSVKSVFKNTGTLKLQDSENNEYEYTCFRSDKYVRGVHVPVEIYFTEDIALDAKRRDFTANAVYFDIKNNAFVDPLNGIPAIKEKRLTTVDKAQKVFGEDGLRLMRLARQAAQLGFSPDEECFLGAKTNAHLICDISPERILTELTSILSADEKYGNTDGPYQGLTLLEQTGVLAHILPELTLGKNMEQRKDFHKYDVLEHSLRAVKYADKKVRFAALLHDIGKPLCQNRDNNIHAHPIEGALLAKVILKRLKASKKQLERIPALVEWHMYDFDCKTSENKLRRFFVEHQDILEDLLLLKQADFSACMDDTSTAPTCQKWIALLDKMHSEKVPFTLKELHFNGADALALGIKPEKISTLLRMLLLHVATHPNENEKARLSKLAIGFANGI